MSDMDFKNFHKNLCLRFGYMHDDKEWKRDLASIEEHIATKLNKAEKRIRELEEDSETCKMGSLSNCCILSGFSSETISGERNVRDLYKGDEQ